tara:strand:+ start:236 stop:874 length:639 start_codon:yes stop_codon:yes gene_type:complete
MRPVDDRLVTIQDEIRTSFNWEISEDIESAQNLANSCGNPKPEIHFSGIVTVVGANAPPNFIPTNPTIVADGAIGAINDYSMVHLLVSDGDGFPYIQNAIDARIPICLHAHGHNQEEWEKVLHLAGEDYPILLTHQTPLTIENMSNPGGFTDGDRAVCIAFALGADSVELVGFSTKEVGPWSGVTDSKRKLIKLKWMSKVLQMLNLGVSDEE